MSTFDYWLIGTFALLIVVNTWFQYRSGFHEGTRGGYAVGMYHAVVFLMRNNSLSGEFNETQETATAADIVVHIMKSVKPGTIPFAEKDDLVKIAEASAEFNKK